MPIEKNRNTRLMLIDRLLRRDVENALTTSEILRQVNERLADEDIDTISERTLREDFKILSEECSEIASKKVERNGSVCTVRFYRETNAENIFTSEITENQRTELIKVMEVIDGFRFLGPWVDEILIALKSQFALKLKDEKIFDTQPILLDDNPDYIGLDYLSEILGAIKESYSLKIVYRPFSRESTAFVFHPHIIKRYNQRWFCIGVEEESDKLKTLAFDRIEKLEKARVKYRKSENSLQDWRDQFDDIVGGTFPTDQNPVELIIKVVADTQFYIETKPLHPSQKRKERTKEFTIFSYKLIPNFELYQKICSYREFVEVLEPEEVRNEMISIVERLGEIYTP